MNRMHAPHFKVADRFVSKVFAAFCIGSVPYGDSEEFSPATIVEHGEFAGPIDGWLPTHQWLERHGMGGAR